MTTFADLRLRTYRLLEDMSGIDSITAGISATPTSGNITISVNDPTGQWPVGARYEVGHELFYVVTNTGANPITVTRAFESTTAESHNSGDLARRDPRFLKSTVDEAINVCLGNWCSFFFPKLEWDTSTAGTFTPIRWIYQAPADAMAVKRVEWQLPGFQRFVPVAHSGLQIFPTSIVASGLGFEVYELGLPGRSVQVLYEKRWPDLVNDSDVLDASFPPDADELVPLGAALYISGWRSIPKFRFDEIELHRDMSQASPPSFNVEWMKEHHDSWYRRAKEVAGRRPVAASPGVVWRGFTN